MLEEKTRLHWLNRCCLITELVEYRFCTSSQRKQTLLEQFYFQPMNQFDRHTRYLLGSEHDNDRYQRHFLAGGLLDSVLGLGVKIQEIEGRIPRPEIGHLKQLT